MQTNWPDPTPEFGQKPRWLLAALIVVGVAGGVIWYLSASPSGVYTRGAPPPPMSALERPAEAPPAADPAMAAVLDAAPFSEGDATTTRQSVPFEDCVAMMANAQTAFSSAPEVLERSADRRVTRLRLATGSVTVTCSRRDGTMTIETEDAPPQK